MDWWEVTTTHGRSFCEKGGCTFDTLAGESGVSARQLAQARLDSGEEIASWFRVEPLHRFPLPPEYGRRRAGA